MDPVMIPPITQGATESLRGGRHARFTPAYDRTDLAMFNLVINASCAAATDIAQILP